MDWLYVIGRVLFSVIFLLSGLGHLTQADAMSQYAASKGVPAPKAATLLSGLMILAGGLSVLLGVYMEIGTWLIVFFLLPAAFKMHNFWAVADPMQKGVERAQFMKNLSMTGAALMLYWVVQTHGYGPFVLGRPL
ncbi:MAG TPA: DoxX family protein [Gemmatimonadota bacterium]|nr:DoxX family protein [Gemmatimonadota bacterium]